MHLDLADGAFQDRRAIAERHPELHLEPTYLREVFLQPKGEFSDQDLRHLLLPFAPMPPNCSRTTAY